MSDRTPFWIQCVTLGDSGNPFSEFHVWRGNDPRPVQFRGDAYWQWQFSDTPYRGNGSNFCWTQALHDGLSGMHSTILHSGNDRFCVIPEHDDYAHVARMWELAQAGKTPLNFEYEMTIIVDDGDTFEGTLAQWRDCFFSNATIETITEYCNEQGWKLEIRY